MNTFYGISFAIYFMFITLILIALIYGLKRDFDKFCRAAILTNIAYFIFVIIYTLLCLRL